MKRLFVLFLCTILSFGIVTSAACDNNTSDKVIPVPPSPPAQTKAAVYGTTLPGAIDDDSYSGVNYFISTAKNSDLSIDDTEKDAGVLISPYYKLEANGTEIPCYFTRTLSGLQSFAYVNAENSSFPIILNIHFGSNEINKSTLRNYGTYTFGTSQNCLTVFVQEKTAYNIPDGYTTLEIEPGEHSENEIALSEENTALIFKAGVHILKYSVQLINNTCVYLENGAYIKVCIPDFETENKEEGSTNGTSSSDTKQKWNVLFYADGANNVKLCGSGVIDLSYIKLDRAEETGKISFYADGCEGVTVEGVTIINPPEQSVYIRRSSEISLKNIRIFAYRTGGSGITLTSCVVKTENGVNSVSGCFVRSSAICYSILSDYSKNITVSNIKLQSCIALSDGSYDVYINAKTKPIENIIVDISSVIPFSAVELYLDYGIYNSASEQFITYDEAYISDVAITCSDFLTVRYEIRFDDSDPDNVINLTEEKILNIRVNEDQFM